MNSNKRDRPKVVKRNFEMVLHVEPTKYAFQLNRLRSYIK
jgi:hypothetical protein